jgi:hypothetical protein
MSQSNVSEVSICNQALTFLGQKPITSLNDASTTAEWMRNNYPFIRDAVLEERMWTFATARASSTTMDRDAWDTAYSHPAPLNWISVFRVYRNSGISTLTSIDWRLEDGNILCSESNILLWGLKRVTDTGKFSPLFVQALAARIAADACIPLTENRQLQADMWNLYSVKLGEAAARDGQQGSNEKVVSDTLVLARSRSGSVYGR